MDWLKRWFWSTPIDNENSAQTVFRMLGNLFRACVSVCIVLGLALAALLWEEKHREDKKKEARASVKISGVNYAPKSCGEDTPILISIKNGTDKEVRELGLKFYATHDGRSTNLLSYNENTRKWDFIIAPQKSAFACYGFGEASKVHDLSKLVWTASIQRYRIKFKR